MMVLKKEAPFLFVELPSTVKGIAIRDKNGFSLFLAYVLRPHPQCPSHMLTPYDL